MPGTAAVLVSVSLYLIGHSFRETALNQTDRRYKQHNHYKQGTTTAPPPSNAINSYMYTKPVCMSAGARECGVCVLASGGGARQLAFEIDAACAVRLTLVRWCVACGGMNGMLGD